MSVRFTCYLHFNYSDTDHIKLKQYFIIVLKWSVKLFWLSSNQNVYIVCHFSFLIRIKTTFGLNHVRYFLSEKKSARAHVVPTVA